MEVKNRFWLREMREKKDVTQSELALFVGCNNRTISNIELGVKNPSGELAYKIAGALEFDVRLFYEHLDEDALVNK